MEQFDQHNSLNPSEALVRHPGTRSLRATYTEPAPFYANEPTDDSGSAGIFEYWNIVRRYKMTLFLFAFCGTLLAILIGVFTTPVYRASTSLEVLNLNQDFMNMKQSSPETTIDYSSDTSEEETQAHLLQSDALLKRVIIKLDPGYVPAANRPRPSATWWRGLLHIPEPGLVTEHERLLAKLADSLKVRVTPRTRLIEATVRSTDPQLAMYFANTLTTEFMEQTLESRWKTSQRTSDWLSRELEAERANLERADDALQAYARDSGLIFTEDSNVATEKLQQLQQQLSAVTGDRITKQSRYELAKHSPPDSLPDVLSDDNLRQSASNIAILKSQIAHLAAIYGPEYSKLQQAQAELIPLQTAFDHDRDAILNRVINDYQEAQRKEELLATAYDAQTREVNGFDEKAVKYNILKREADSNRQLYDTMLLQLKESSLASALHATNVRVVDGAEVPVEPVWPNFLILGPVGLMSGLFLGFGAVIMRERADRRIQQPGETQLWTNLPELGTIPSASMDGGKKAARRIQNSKNGDRAASRDRILAPADEKGSPSIELATWNRKPSLVAEAFRATLTSILFVGENGSRPKIVLLASANAGEGKTTIVCNLGIAMAEIRQSVLIIDADLRRPRLHDLFNLPNERGLSDLLKEQTLSDDAIKALVQETEVPGLDVLTCGPPTHASANLLYSPNLGELLTKFRKQYDMILIDTPPMLQLTDARVIARLVDGVILVARAEQTTRDAIVAASQRFSEDRIGVFGTILNDWNPKRSPNGHYGYHTYSYYTSGYSTTARSAKT